MPSAWIALGNSNVVQAMEQVAESVLVGPEFQEEREHLLEAHSLD